jgi:hypothetical protein
VHESHTTQALINQSSSTGEQIGYNQDPNSGSFDPGPNVRNHSTTDLHNSERNQQDRRRYMELKLKGSYLEVLKAGSKCLIQGQLLGYEVHIEVLCYGEQLGDNDELFL